MNVQGDVRFYTIVDDLGCYCDEYTVHKCPIEKRWTYLSRSDEKMPRRVYKGSEIDKIVEKLRKNIHKVEEANKERTFIIKEI